MTARSHDASPDGHHGPAVRGTGANRWKRNRRAGSARVRPPAQRNHPSGTESPSTQVHSEELWERHGRAVYALACALLGDEAAAEQAVTLAIRDLARSGNSASTNTHRSLARHVYLRSQAIAGETTGPQELPRTMVWLGQLAQLQRTCLALCVFGGHTHREAASLLGLPPRTVAGLLRSGLHELGRAAPEPRKDGRAVIPRRGSATQATC